jgi:hypothetical protein
MKPFFCQLLAVFLTLFVFNMSATVLYVDLNSPNPTPPYTNWATAATNIQDAITASAVGDIVVVTNGVYANGGKSMDGLITNRVSLDKAITVQSVNGPFVTVIQGAGATNGPAAVRCAWLTNNATLIGFKLQGGATLNSGTAATFNGGGVWCASSNACVASCVIESNTAGQYGGGAYQGSLWNCFLAGNNNGGAFGAAACNSLLNHCTVVSNKTGIYFSGSPGTPTNCIIYFNSMNNFMGAAFAYCCTTPLPAGTGNFTNSPGLFVDGIHLSSGSPCIGAGINVFKGTDIFGQTWANPPSIGCAEWQPAPMIQPPQIQLTGVPVGFIVGPLIVNGQPPLAFQWLKDGAPIQNDGHFSGSQTTNLIATGIKLSDAGGYQVVASNAFGMVTSAVAQVVFHYADAAGTNPQSPYTNWVTAATNIQDAVDAAVAGEVIMVTNGVYAIGGRVMPGTSTNRVVLDKALTVVSVNGYTTTMIQGAWDPVSTNGPLAVRCAWLTNGAVLSGFTLENGATSTGGIVGDSSDSGGGVWCTSTNSVVSNCLLTNNSAIFGGGMANGTLNNSLVAYNQAAYGGGACDATLNNCTLVNNLCMTPSYSDFGGGTYDCVARNSIVIGNADNFLLGNMDNYYYDPSYFSERYSYSYSYPLTSGTGNINGTNSPQFLDSFHIATTSPCCSAGSALYASGTDLDGEPWANPPSMGCDEVVVSNLVGPLSVNILTFQTNLLVGLPGNLRFGYFQGIVTGHAAYVTWSFGDGPTSTNFGVACSHQWTNTGDYFVTLTAYNNDNPTGVSTNILIHVLLPNVPPLQSPVLLTNGFQFQFAGQWSAYYNVQYTTNLAPPVVWQTLVTNYFGTDGMEQILDFTPTDQVRFYRVGVQ